MASEALEHPTALDWQNRAERAEAECRELRNRIILLEEDIADAARDLAAWQDAAQYGE